MREARFRFGALFAITVAMTVFVLTVGDSRLARAVEMLAAAAGLLVAVATSGARPARRHAAAGAIALVLVGLAIASATDTPAPTIAYATAALLLALTVAVIARGLARLIVRRGVDLTAVFGALSVYLLIGLTFCFLYGAIATGYSVPFFEQGTDGTQADRAYYSFTAMTTTGFGDFTARSRGGHALTVLEMLIGQLYLVTVIALLVSNLRRRPNDASSPARGDA